MGLKSRPGQAWAGAWETVTETVKSLASSKLTLVGIGTLGVVGLNLSFNNSIEKYYKNQIIRRVERGFSPDPPPVDLGGHRLQRKDLKNLLKDLFSQKDPSRFYYVLKGHAGAGKSTVVREACREVGGGVGYLEVSPVPEDHFGQQLGAAIDFNFEEQINLLNSISRVLLGSPIKSGEKKLESLTKAAEALREAANEYRLHHGRPFVLVIDGVDRLTGPSEETLLVLQDYAKEWAEHQQVTLVFIVSETATLELMRKQQSWSRAFEPFDIPYVSDAESLSFLRGRGVGPVLAEKVVEIVGGDFLEMEKAALLLRNGVSLEDAVAILLRDVEPRYAMAGLLDGTPHQSTGLKVVRALLESGTVPLSIPAAEWRKLASDPETQGALMKGNVFDFDYNKLTFANRLVASYGKFLLPQRIANKEALGH